MHLVFVGGQNAIKDPRSRSTNFQSDAAKADASGKQPLSFSMVMTLDTVCHSVLVPKLATTSGNRKPLNCIQVHQSQRLDLATLPKTKLDLSNPNRARSGHLDPIQSLTV